MMSDGIREYRKSPNILENIRNIFKKYGIEDSKYSLWGYKEGSLCIADGLFGFEVYFATGNGDKRDIVELFRYPDAIINLVQRCCIGQDITELLKEFTVFWDAEVNYDWDQFNYGSPLSSGYKESGNIRAKKRNTRQYSC